MTLPTIKNGWKELLNSELKESYFQELLLFVEGEYKNNAPIYPPKELIFNAFDRCTLENTKVVIIGQDPYHGEGQANGLSFSVNPNVAIPPSLRNIFKELIDDTGCKAPTNGDLSHWADQGVLLLNATLTVRAKTPNSHQNRGWERFTDAVIRKLADNKKNIVFILWGKSAQQKGDFINKERHLVLSASHPSPFAAYRGFFGCKHFSLTNTYLETHKETPIRW